MIIYEMLEMRIKSKNEESRPPITADSLEHCSRSCRTDNAMSLGIWMPPHDLSLTHFSKT